MSRPDTHTQLFTYNELLGLPLFDLYISAELYVLKIQPYIAGGVSGDGNGTVYVCVLAPTTNYLLWSDSYIRVN